MKAKIVIPVIILLFIVGGLIWYYKFRKKSPEEIEQERLNKLIAEATAKIKAIEAQNAGKTIEETGGRIGAVRTANSITKEQWNLQLKAQIESLTINLNEYYDQAKKIQTYIENATKQVVVQKQGSYFVDTSQISAWKSQLFTVNTYIGVILEQINKLKSLML